MPRVGVYTSLRGRIGGLTRSATSDMRILARSGQVGLRRKFENEVDPDGSLAPAERARRADAARRLHFSRLALASARARRARGRRTEGAS